MSEREGRLPTAEHKRRVEAWWTSRSDHEAAEKLALEYAAFSQWRRQIGLPPRTDVTRREGIPVREAEGILQDLDRLVYASKRLREGCERAAKAHAMPEKKPRGWG